MAHETPPSDAVRKRALVFFPQNPQPPKSGAHKRCLEILESLRALGYDVMLASTTVFAQSDWQPESIDALKARYVSDVRVHQAGVLDRLVVRIISKLYRLQKRDLPIDSLHYCPPGLTSWFRKLAREIVPDVFVINYAYWDGLLPPRASDKALRVMDTLDIVSLNTQMATKVQALLQQGTKLTADDVPEAMLQEDYFDRLDLHTDPKEFAIYDRYDTTIAICEPEANLLRANTKRTHVVTIPVSTRPVNVANSYSAPALFPTGPNPFNILGYLYFVKRVLPLIRERTDAFRLDVTGYACDYVVAEPEVMLRGFVPDLDSVYAAARFMVCPVYGLTGQQIKIVESMAHGVPVIALRTAAERSPIIHEVNGLAASSAEEFAEHVVRLWNDPALCTRLGQAARETIAAEFSPTQIVAQLSDALTRQR